jgi:hypothetical protein
MNVSFQYVLAYPGQLAALRPNSLIYQLEQPAWNTEPLSWAWMSLTHWFSAVPLTSMIDALWSMMGARSVRATYSICTSQEKRAELCAGNVLGPKLHMLDRSSNTMHRLTVLQN